MSENQESSSKNQDVAALTLFARIQAAKAPLAKFKEGEACIYPEPYQGKAEVVRWFYSRDTHTQVFFACSQEVSDIIEENTWAEVSGEFTVYVEHELMPHCVENTNWEACDRDGVPYDEETEEGNSGCEGGECYCEPFATGDFTYGIADEDEFDLTPKETLSEDSHSGDGKEADNV